MTKSNEIHIEKTTSLPASLDYSKLPKKILDAITTSQYEIDREGKLTWDGKQFVVRIPKEVSLEMGIKEGEHIKFSILKKFGASVKPDLRIELMRNGKEK
ncbi:MAG: hypothetical protein ACREBJ_03975 [Nitrosotalea sp.]